MDLVDAVYGITRSFLKDEQLGLTTQLRRAACSVPMNIAEGRGRGTRRGFAHFVSIARGSLTELDTALEIACRQGLLQAALAARLHAEARELERMLSRLRTKLLAAR